MKLPKRFVLLTVIVVIFAIVGSSVLYLKLQGNYQGTVESITVGNAQSFECDTLVYIAQDQGFFANYGLRVAVKNYTSGAVAVNDLMKGEVDIAATAEFPLVRRALQGDNVSALCCIGKFELQALIGRKDHGIESVSDLVGKTIGVPLGTVSEFYVGRFLELNGISRRDVTFVNVDPAESVDAIVNGSVDALIIWQPYAYSAVEQLGDGAVVWSVQSSQRVYIVEVARNEWIAQHSDLVNRFLRALAQAEDYYTHNSAQATALMQESLNYTDAYMAAIWNRNEFSLSLDQSLISAMENEARWIINNNLTNQTVFPDFLDYMYLEGLNSVKPESVNVIR